MKHNLRQELFRRESRLFQNRCGITPAALAQKSLFFNIRSRHSFGPTVRKSNPLKHTVSIFNILLPSQFLKDTRDSAEYSFFSFSFKAQQLLASTCAQFLKPCSHLYFANSSTLVNEYWFQPVHALLNCEQKLYFVSAMDRKFFQNSFLSGYEEISINLCWLFLQNFTTTICHEHLALAPLSFMLCHADAIRLSNRQQFPPAELILMSRIGSTSPSTCVIFSSSNNAQH